MNNRSEPSTPEANSPEKAGGPESSDVAVAPAARADTDNSIPRNLGDSDRGKARKRAHSPKPDAGVGSKGRLRAPTLTKRLDFGQEGLSNALRLEDSGRETLPKSQGGRAQPSRMISVQSLERNERKHSENATSSGDVSDKVRRARLESTSKFRGEYQNECARTHKECSWFGCKCGTTPVDDGTVVHSAAESVANVGSEQAGGGTVGEGERSDGAAGGPTAQLDGREGDPIRLEGSDGAAGGGRVLPGVAAEFERDHHDISVGNGKVAEQCMLQFTGQTISVRDGPGGGALRAADTCRAAGQDGSVAAVISDPQAAEGCPSPSVLASTFINNMPALEEREFASVRKDGASHDPAVVNAAIQNMARIAANDQVPNIRPRAEKRCTSTPNIWRAGGRVSRKEKERRGWRNQTQPADSPLVLSEENKEHLKIIATSLISDMTPAVQRLVASDPRIMRWGSGFGLKFKEKIIKEYRAQLQKKRKDEITLLQAAATLSKNAVSTKSYRAIRHMLQGMGLGWCLPTERDLGESRRMIEKCALEDLDLYSTPDGWFASLRQVVEHEMDRMSQMPVEKTTQDEAGGRSIGHAGPGMHGWQDLIYCKITCDARRITKKCSITEMMLHVFRKGKQGAADSQRAMCIRTMGMWLGKDSRENVIANATKFFQQCQSLQTEGIVFDACLQTFLGRTEALSALSEEEKLAEEGAAQDKKRFFPVQVKFWFPADMAAQCAVIGHGCAGHHYCAHCMMHENERHLPYVLVTTTKSTNLQAMAHEYDLHARTLYAINTGVDHKGVQILTEQGLRQSTVLDAEARAALAQAPEPEPDQEGQRRTAKKRKTAPRPKNGPDVGVINGLVGWRDPANHSVECECTKCVIPVGTCVRVIPTVEFSRPSEYLREHFPDLTADRCPFCALHCKMRVAETMFQQICAAAESSKAESQLVKSMNDALRREGIGRQYKKTKGSKTYEKISFEGHQVMALLKKGPDGKMGIERVLEAMWPGAADDIGIDKAYGIKFVPRTIEVWRQFALVEKLMSERDFDVLKGDVSNGEDGFARFGKECREFIFRFQSMSTVDYSKAYYLHTLLHHAGDFMRALQSEGFTLGMMSNSGAERRHEYGRRASRKALASNGWRKKNPEYDKKENLLIYLTMKEVLMWDYGEDLISYTIAKRIRDGHLEPPQEDGQVQKKLDFSGIKSRKALLSEEEARMEYDAQPDDPPPDFETSNSRFWTRTGKKQAYALIGVAPEDSDDEGDDGVFDPDHEPKLFSYVPVPFSDDVESEAGSEIDMHFEYGDGLTMNSFDFLEQDEGEDADADFVMIEEEEEEEEEWMTSAHVLKGRPRPQSPVFLARSDRRARPTTGMEANLKGAVSEAEAHTSPQEGPAHCVASAQVAPTVQGCSALSAAVISSHAAHAGEADDSGSRRRAPIAPPRRTGRSAP